MNAFSIETPKEQRRPGIYTVVGTIFKDGQEFFVLKRDKEQPEKYRDVREPGVPLLNKSEEPPL